MLLTAVPGLPTVPPHWTTHHSTRLPASCSSAQNNSHAPGAPARSQPWPLFLILMATLPSAHLRATGNYLSSAGGMEPCSEAVSASWWPCRWGLKFTDGSNAYVGPPPEKVVYSLSTFLSALKLLI